MFYMIVYIRVTTANDSIYSNSLYINFLMVYIYLFTTWIPFPIKTCSQIFSLGVKLLSSSKLFNFNRTNFVEKSWEYFPLQCFKFVLFAAVNIKPSKKKTHLKK